MIACKEVILLLFLTLQKIRADCTTTYITICENLEDVRLEGSSEWTNLIIQSDVCVTIQENSLEILKQAAFSAVPNLEEMYIVEKLQLLESGAFDGLNKLNYLKLYKNVIKVIPAGVFSQLSELKKLDLQRNSIENLAHGVFANASIKQINLSHNKLSNIQVDMLNNPSIKTLIITHNDLNLIVEGAFHENLQHLDLSNNEIKNLNINNILRNLKNLQVLRLKNNGIPVITSLPALRKLRILDLSHNAIQNLGNGAFTSYPKLKELFLCYNKIFFLNPNSFTSPSPIESLYIQRNLLAFIPGEFGDRDTFSNLKQIGIGGNPWSCACYDSVNDFIKSRNIQKEECDQRFFNDGTNPVCVIAYKKCYGNETEYFMNQPEIYNNVVESYKCT